MANGSAATAPFKAKPPKRSAVAAPNASLTDASVAQFSQDSGSASASSEATARQKDVNEKIAAKTIVQAINRNENLKISRSGFSPRLFQDVLHLMDNLAALQRFARFVFRVSLEERPHLIRHSHQLMITLFSERSPIVVEPLAQLPENIVQV